MRNLQMKRELNCRRISWLALFFGTAWGIAWSCSASATEEFVMDTSSIGKSNGVIRSEQILELGVPTANALRLEGEQSMRLGSIDRAIMVLQRAVEMAPLDMDGRIMYAEALEKKLLKQKDKDPALYNFVVKQWLFVAKKADFLDQTHQALGHLMNLTGRKPGRLERSRTFLAKVLLPEDGSTMVALGKKRPEIK